MAITTFDELKTAIANWLDRTDLTTRIPEFIYLAEAKINRVLAVRQQTTVTSLTVTSGAATLPTDYLSHKRLTWQSDPTQELDYLTPTGLSVVRAAGSQDTPAYFTIEGSTLKVAPSSDGFIEIAYAQKVPHLSDDATTNWLLAAHPDGYLWASLTMSATFTSDAGNGRAWNELAEQFLGELWSLNFRGNDQMVQRPAGPTP